MWILKSTFWSSWRFWAFKPHGCDLKITISVLLWKDELFWKMKSKLLMKLYIEKLYWILEHLGVNQAYVLLSGQWKDLYLRMDTQKTHITIKHDYLVVAYIIYTILSSTMIIIGRSTKLIKEEKKCTLWTLIACIYPPILKLQFIIIFVIHNW